VKIIKGYRYKLRLPISQRHGIYQDVIAANEGGAKGFYALALLKNPKEINHEGKVILHKYLTVKHSALL